MKNNIKAIVRTIHFIISPLFNFIGPTLELTDRHSLDQSPCDSLGHRSQKMV